MIVDVVFFCGPTFPVYLFPREAPFFAIYPLPFGHIICACVCISSPLQTSSCSWILIPSSSPTGSLPWRSWRLIIIKNMWKQSTGRLKIRHHLGGDVAAKNVSPMILSTQPSLQIWYLKLVKPSSLTISLLLYKYDHNLLCVLKISTDKIEPIALEGNE